MSDKLKEITYLTVNELKEQEIILPGKYSDIFESFAKKLKVEIDNQDVILKELNQECEHVQKIVNKTNDNLTGLQQSTNNARDAIKRRDEDSLEAIYKELEVMQSQINELQKELFSDNLTKAYNRKWFKDHYLKDGKFPNEGCLAFIDLDKFKDINDNYGHIIGDQVLKYLVRFLNTELNQDGVHVVRYAGDEFITVFDDKISKKIDAEATFAKLRKKLSKQRLKTAKVSNIQFGFSYGIVSYTQADTFDDIIEQADELMYKNKQANR